MKRLPVLLSVLLLVLLTGCGDDLPPDYVKGNKIVIDNETPFVYTENAPRSTEIYRLFSLSRWDEPFAYSEIAEYFGTKIIRYYEENGEEYYYTVYSAGDNGLAYLWMTPDENGTLRFSHPFNEYYMFAHALLSFEGVPMFDYDRPPAILGDRLPIKYQKEYYSFDEIARRTENVWQEYSHYCASADLPSHFEYLYDPEISEFWRCMQSVSFDVTDKDSRRAADGLYVYDLIRYKDGRNVLHFRHLTDWAYPRHELVQVEILTLTAEEAEAIFTVLEEANVSDIPTWNPEESSGFDGETTYVLSPHKHLIGMWCATERYGIYHIREAFEEIVRNRITVTSGRIYN